MRLRDIYISLEADPDGVARAEVEHVLICSINDFEQLKKASRTELQEQYELRTCPSRERPGGGSIRVRAIDNKTYVLTTKVFYKGRRGCKETEMEVSKDLFEHFKSLAPVGSKKLRHFFPVEGTDLEWEVDVYFDEDGNYLPWCRAEIEVDRLNVKLPPLPIECGEVLPKVLGKPTDEEAETIDRLYKEKFIFHRDDNMLPLAE